MRKIEFKFWNTKENKMVYANELGYFEKAFLHENGFNQTVNLGIMLNLDFMVTLQYTGLKDKNGIKIFEGDIIKRVSVDWDVEDVHKVVWGGKSYPAFDVKPYYEGDSNFFSDYYCQDSEWGTLEVIGNIYENTELLEGEK